MRIKQLFLTLTLLCAVVQGAWALVSWDGSYNDVWDGHTTTKPQFMSSFHSDYYGKDLTNVVVINTAAELAYIRDHWSEYSDWQDQKVYYKLNYIVNADIDMGDAVSWVPMANSYGYSFAGIFLGQGHTIRIHIWGTDDNYQGLFGSLYDGVVMDIHVAGKIECGSQYVGGIAGYLGHSGLIENCWVSADVSSTYLGVVHESYVAGIVGKANCRITYGEFLLDFGLERYAGGGLNYCIMTGNVTNDDRFVGGIIGYKEEVTPVSHGVMYGTVSSAYKQHDVFFGSAPGGSDFIAPTYMYSDYNDSECRNSRAKDWYSYAMEHPYAVNVSNVGQGILTPNFERTYPGQTVKLTKKVGNAVARVTVKDIDGHTVAVSGNETDGWTFTMPRRDVNVTVTYYDDFGHATDDGMSMDVWDGETQVKPNHIDESTGTVHIHTAAEMEYIRAHFDDFAMTDYFYYQCNYILEKDLDMTAKTWKPLISMMAGYYRGTFNGNGHTIRIKIEGANDNYQGLFAGIFSGAVVENLHVAGSIHCTGSRLVGGIAGENDGTIRNCWVSADVSSDWTGSGYAKVGGIAGENYYGTIEFCCMTGNVKNMDDSVGGVAGSNYWYGNIKHCTFYGTLTLNPDMWNDNKWAGDENPGGEEDNYDTYAPAHYEYADGAGCHMYSDVYKYPYRIGLSRQGGSTYVASAGGEEGVPGTRHGETVTLTKSGKWEMHRVDIKDADGNSVSYSGDINGTLTFVMPRRDVTITASSLADWPTQGSGTEADPYVINSEKDWNGFVNNVSGGRNYSGQHVKLDADISVLTVVGSSETNGFQGTFDGGGHTITATITDASNEGTALFRYINGVTIKNLKVAGTISGGIHAAAIVGIAKGTGNVIEGCVATANVTGGTHIGGILGHGTTSDIAISGCVFSGKMNGGYEAKGALFGWGDNGGTKSVTDCLYLMADGQYTKNLDLVRLYGGTVSVTNCYKNTSAGSEGTQCIFTTSAPSQLGTLVHDYGLVKVYENALFCDGKYYLSPTTSTNAGTEGDPYIIADEADWVSFAKWIDEHRDGFTGEYVQLMADITVSTPAGTSDTPFSGTFLGNGHTITANITDTSNQGTALFRYINGATIKDLTVGGTITGGMHAAAIVGFAQGTGNSIRNCVATANVSGGTHIGGILGHGTSSDIAISGCVFSGTMTGGGSAKGAIFGWGDNGGTKSVTDCLYVMADGQNTDGLDLVRLNSGTVSVANSYKTTSVGSYATKTYASATVNGDLGDLTQDYGVLTAYQNGILYDGMYYMAPVALSGSGTVEDPYLINNTYEWNSFTINISNGTNYSGQYVQLSENISVSTMAGTSEANSFKGTFLGGGHTINAAINNTGNDGTALFRYINGATIKNLTVSGTIIGGMHAAAIVGFAKGKGNSIRNCVTTAYVSGGTHIGGILGHGVDSDIAISGCVFSGMMRGGGTAKGAIVGWGDNGGTKSVTDCLYLMADGQNTDGLDLVRLSGGTVSVANSYKTTSAGSNGTQCLPVTTAPATLGDLTQDYGVLTAYANSIFYDGTYYMAPATLAGSGTEADPYIISSIYEWDSFVHHVNEGTTYSDQYVKLTADISVAKKCGTVSGSTPERAFSGTFLGGDHTITATITDTDNQGTALFSYINGATIMNLKVAGTINGGMYAAAIVGFAKGTGNWIHDCVATADVSGGTHIGGILGHGTDSDIQIDGSVFSGKMTGGDIAKGAIFGWGYEGGVKKIITDCLYLMADGQNTDGLDLVRQDDKGIVYDGNCYKTTKVGSYGAQCFPVAADPSTLGEVLRTYNVLTAYQKGILYDGTYYMNSANISLANASDNSTTISANHGNLANVTLLGRTLYKDGSWNTLCLPFSVADFNGTPLQGATVKTLASTTFSDGTLTMNFSDDLTGIEAGKPYIVKWDNNVVNLSTLTTDYTVQNGDVLTGTLGGDYKISIAAGAIVTLHDATINGEDKHLCVWAGITCQGDATIILKGENTVKGFYRSYPGIYVPSGSTLTIVGSGVLNASSNGRAAGIGGGQYILNSCGNIVIEGGTINAEGRGKAAGIGGGEGSSCGYITITDGVTKVTATKGESAPNSIGAGSDGSCGTVTIGGTVGAITDDKPYTGNGTGGTIPDVKLADIVNPVFTGVTISDVTANAETDYVDFVGTYSPVGIYTADKTNLYIGADNKLYYPTASDFTVNACRGYFQLKQGLKAGDPKAGVRTFKLNFGDNSEVTTGIITTNFTNSTNSDNEWYSLDGRKLNGKPAQRGVYINNGNKIVIK